MSLPEALARLAAGLSDADEVARVVAGRSAPGGGRRAAVAILVSEEPDARRIVFVEKTATLRKHAGQVAFPGGAVEPGDPDAVFAALREAEEEVGVEPATVTVLGVLPPAQVRATGFDVTGVVGWWREPVALRPVDVGEVAAVHQLPVAALVDPANRLTWEHPSGFSGPGFVIGDLFIWGFTAHLLDGLLDLAGWAEPWDAARTSSIPRRFLHGRR